MHPKKLDALTSARFFAAAAIVIGHLHDRFGSLGLASIPLNQGVSFFFVLSGFILFYNYRRFSDIESVKGFIVARLARIWPVHLFCLILFFALLPAPLWYIPYPTPTLATLLLSNLLLIQSWIPFRSFWLSLNGVAWSISVELFFYLMFPAVIVFQRHIRIFLVVSFAITVTMCLLADQNGVPVDLSAGEFTVYGLIYASPLSRLFEFIVGISAAKAFLSGRFDHLKGNWAEFGTLAAVAVFLWTAPAVSTNGGFRAAFGPAIAFWYVNAGGVLFFAALIFALAGGCGLLARGLCWKPLVFLGEVSFAIYLVHQILNRAWDLYFGFLKTSPVAFQSLVFWTVLIAAASAIHLLVENPARRLIVTMYRHRFSRVSPRGV